MFAIAIIVGWVVGTLALPNVVLPLLWSWPRARRLEREDKLTKPIPAATLLLAPFIWSVLLGVSVIVALMFVPSVSTYYLAGLAASLLQTMWGLISRKDVPQMEAAFSEQWREHLR